MENQEQQFLCSGICTLEKCCNKCLSVAGDCWKI